jgi:sporulation protein YlmC with PRC-barrel domain
VQELLSRVKGRVVLGAGGRVFGDLEEVIIDWQQWRVLRVVVRIDSDAVEALGLRKPYWRRARLSIPVDHVSSAHDEIVLRTTLDEFGALLDEDAIDADVF